MANPRYPERPSQEHSLRQRSSSFDSLRGRLQRQHERAEAKSQRLSWSSAQGSDTRDITRRARPESHSCPTAAQSSHLSKETWRQTRPDPSIPQGKDFFENLKEYTLDERELRENGFPRYEAGELAEFHNRWQQSGPGLKTDEKKNCVRCGVEFIVHPSGDTNPVGCRYHKARAARSQGDRIHPCCKASEGSPGCHEAKAHVHDSNKLDQQGYVKMNNWVPAIEGQGDGRILDKEGIFQPVSLGDKVYALDCEMVYTVQGRELGRVTLVDDEWNTVFDAIVKPGSKIIDYCTEYSGLTEKDFDGVTRTLQDVQAELQLLITSRTILVGHSLENDLMALKIIHDLVVDTSLVYPHTDCPRYKLSLKRLASVHLGLEIQNSDAGHNSAEDARTCMQLLQFKLHDGLGIHNRDDRRKRRENPPPLIRPG